MFGKKKSGKRIEVADVDDEAVAGSGKTPPGGGGIGKYVFLAVFLSALVMAAAGAGLGWLQFIKQKELSEIQLAGEVARQNATLVSAIVKQSQEEARHLAESQLVRDAVVLGTEASTSITVSQLVMGGDVVLIPSDSLQAAADLSFSARDLILKARRGERPQPVFLPGKPPVLLVAHPVENGAVLLLRKELGLIGELIREQELQGSWVRVRSKDDQVLFVAGQQVEGQQANAAALAGVTAHAVVPPGEEDPALVLLYLMIAGGMLVLVVLVIISSLLAVGRGMKKDAALLANLASDLTQHGQASTRAGFTFSTLELVTSSIRKLSEQGGHAGSVPARKKTRSDDEFMAVSQNEMAGLTGGDEDAPTVVQDALANPGSDLPDLPDLAGGGDDATVVNNSLGGDVSEDIFREYDIRGESGKTLTAEVAQLIGRAVGSESLPGGNRTVVVARDGRLSSPELCQSLVQGLLASGCDVVDLGEAPTPVLYYALKALDHASGVMVTGSHNPPSHNGFKMVVGGTTLHGDRVRGLYQRIQRSDFESGAGSLSEAQVTEQYVQDVVRDIVMARPMKVVIDTANGIAGRVAPALFRQLGCEVIPLFEEVDGHFPNHSPDTSKPENYAALIEAVQQHQAELGLAFDGDADRVGLVTPSGEIIWPDRLMMLLARDLLARSPGADVLFDVKCSRELSRLIMEHGGRPVMTPSGHSLVKARMRDTGAPLAGEMSGHIFFADRWNGYDDGLYAAARLLEILSLESASVDEVFAQLTTGPSTPELTIAVPDSAKFAVVKKLQGMAANFAGDATTLDGLRVDFDDGWGLVRASNTTPAIVARFEGRDEAALERIKGEFRSALQQVSSKLKLPF